MEWWHIYLFTRLDSFNIVMCILFFLAWFMVLLTVIVYVVSEGEIPSERMISKYWRRCVGGIVALSALCVMIPSQKEVAAIYLLPKLARSDFAKEAQQLPTDAAKLMRLKLESWISDMEPKKAKGEGK